MGKSFASLHRGRITAYPSLVKNQTINMKITQLILLCLFAFSLTAQTDKAERLTQFIEQTLAADGTLLLKYWLHLPREQLKRRMVRAALDQSSS